MQGLRNKRIYKFRSLGAGAKRSKSKPPQNGGKSNLKLKPEFYKTVDPQTSNKLENVQFQKLEIDDFEILNEIGSGTNGTVFKAQLLHPEKLGFKSNKVPFFAIKKISLGDKCKDNIKEVFMLKNIDHPNIIKCYDSFVDSDYLYIVMDYAEQGDLLSLIEKQKVHKRFFAEKLLWKFAWQLCLGLLHLHANNIIHRDIKTLNIMIKDDVLKIADLGESRFLDQTDFLKGKTVGTPMFLSPEVVRKENYDHRVDVWALGCVLYHMATFEPPFCNEEIEPLLYAIKYKNPKPFHGCYSQKFQEFVLKMLSKKKAERPFVSELFEYFPQNFQFATLVDMTNFNKVSKSEIRPFEKNMVDKRLRISGLDEIDHEFIALKNRQILQKCNFTNSFKRRNKQMTLDLANVFQSKRREGREGYHKNYICEPTQNLTEKHASGNMMGYLRNKITIHEEKDDSLSRGSDSILHEMREETKIKSDPLMCRKDSTKSMSNKKVYRVARKRTSIDVNPTQEYAESHFSIPRESNVNKSQPRDNWISSRSNLPSLNKNASNNQFRRSHNLRSSQNLAHKTGTSMGMHPGGVEEKFCSNRHVPSMLPDLGNVNYNWSSRNKQVSGANPGQFQFQSNNIKTNSYCSTNPTNSVRKSMEAPVSEYTCQAAMTNETSQNFTRNPHTKSIKFSHAKLINPKVRKSKKKFNIHMISNC